MGWLQATKTIGLVIGGSIAGMWVTLTILNNVALAAADGSTVMLVYMAVYIVGGIVPPVVVILVIIHRYRVRVGLWEIRSKEALPVWMTVSVLGVWAATNIPQVISTIELYRMMLV